MDRRQLILALIFEQTLPGPAALSCSLETRPGERPPLHQVVSAEFANSDLVAEAKAVEIIDDPNAALIRFKPLRVWKGESSSGIATTISDRYCPCGETFTLNETYILYLSETSRAGIYSRPLCRGGHSIAAPDVEKEREILDRLSSLSKGHNAVSN